MTGSRATRKFYSGDFFSRNDSGCRRQNWNLWLTFSNYFILFCTTCISSLLCHFFSRPRKCTWKRQLFCHSFIFFLLCGSALYPEYKLHYGLQCPQEVITVLLCPFSDAGNQKSPFVISDWRKEMRMRLLLGCVRV